MTTAPLVSLADVRTGSAVFERCEGDYQPRGGVVVKVAHRMFDSEVEDFVTIFHTLSLRHGKLVSHVLRADQVDPETIDRLDRRQCRQIVRWCAAQIASRSTNKPKDTDDAELAAIVATLTEALVGPGWSE